MSLSRLQLESAIASARRTATAKGETLRCLALRSETRWSGDDSIEIADNGTTERWRIAWAASPLQARRLLGSLGDDDRAILITPLDNAALGEEVIARLAFRRVRDVDQWEALRHAFGATSLDPRLGTAAWMVPALLESRPAKGFKARSGGVLDLEALWDALLEPLGLPGRPSAIDLLDASASGRLGPGFARVSPEHRPRIAGHCEETAGAAGPVLAAMLRGGHAERLAALGLVVDVAVREPQAIDGPDAADAGGRMLLRARLEERFGVPRDAWSGAAAAWASAATTWAERQSAAAGGRDAGTDGGHLGTAIDQAEHILRDELDGASFAILSDVLRSSIAARGALLARRIMGLLARTDAAGREVEHAGVAAAIARLHEHRVFARHPHHAGDRRRVMAAERLCRWLSAPVPSIETGDGPSGGSSSLADLARLERDELSWADRARRVVADGSSGSDLDLALQRLAAEAGDRRERFAAVFARTLQRATVGDGGTGDILPLEGVLEAVIQPITERKQKAIVVVMDGMSASVLHGIAESITRRGGFERQVPAGRADWPPILAPLPTITRVARTALFCGRLPEPGEHGQDAERRGLAALAERHGWRGQTASSDLVFHKNELTESGGRLGGAVLKALASTAAVVAVVVNVIDDLLDKGDQLRPDWSLGQVPILDALVQQAELERRVLVLVSDHGHVREEGDSKGETDPAGGARWRPSPHGGAPTHDGELVLRGARVVDPTSGPGGELALPWSERLRYAGKAAGYHGGVNPQEVVVPLAVFVPRNVAATDAWDWQAEPVEPPSWWTGRSTRTTPPSARPGALDRGTADTTPTPAPTKPVAPPTLFDPPAPTTDVEPVATRSWIDRLIESPMYAEQEAMAGRRPPDRSLVRRILVALDDAGGYMTLSSLATTLGASAFTLRSPLTAVSRVVNVEGYLGLELNNAAGELRLHADVLREQFELDQEPESGA